MLVITNINNNKNSDRNNDQNDSTSTDHAEDLGGANCHWQTTMVQGPWTTTLVVILACTLQPHYNAHTNPLAISFSIRWSMIFLSSIT